MERKNKLTRDKWSLLKNSIVVNKLSSGIFKRRNENTLKCIASCMLVLSTGQASVQAGQMDPGQSDAPGAANSNAVSSKTASSSVSKTKSANSGSRGSVSSSAKKLLVSQAGAANAVPPLLPSSLPVVPPNPNAQQNALLPSANAGSSQTTSSAAPAGMRHHATVERKDPYANEKQKQLQPTPISPEPVVKRKEELETVPYQSQEDKQQENLLPLTRPSLKALISVDRHLDPFGMESSYSEEVGLRDVLKAAIGGNLDIKNVQANERAQKYTYLSAFSKFLPDTIMGYNLYYVDGSIVLPGGFGGAGGAAATSKINSGFTLMNAALRYRMYQGGAVLFGELAAKHQWRAAKSQVVGNVNDVLLDSARRYYDLLRQQALLHIRIRAVDTSTEQLRRNTDLEANGLATNLDILQARTQLARDRQNLVDQQSQRRNAAILLAQTLNSSLGQDLIPSDKVVGKMRLIAKETQIADLLKLAIDNRPELKQYDELRQAAKAQVMVALAPLHPQVALTTSTYGVGTLSQLGALLNIGFGVNWTLGGMGLTDTYNAQTAKYRTRQALVRANQEFVNIFGQVRTAYVNMLSAEQRIEETTDEVYSAQEELRLSRLRLDSGLGTNLDVLTAQRDLTQAYIDKVEAIINFNVAQVQLVHDIGLISVDTLTSNKPLTISAPQKH